MCLLNNVVNFLHNNFDYAVHRLPLQFVYSLLLIIIFTEF